MAIVCLPLLILATKGFAPWNLKEPLDSSALTATLLRGMHLLSELSDAVTDSCLDGPYGLVQLESDLVLGQPAKIRQFDSLSEPGESCWM